MSHGSSRKHYESVHVLGDRNDIRAIKHSATDESTDMEVNECRDEVPLGILALYAKVDVAHCVYSVGTGLQVEHDQLWVGHGIHLNSLYVWECRDSGV